MASINPTNISILNALLSIYGMLVQQLTQLLRKFWAAPGVDPIVNVTSLGTNAVGVFTVASAATTFLQSVATTLGLPPPSILGVPFCYSLTPNADGSMTCVAVAATVPANLAIAGGALTWTAAVGATSYTIQKSTDGGNTWTTLVAIKGRDLWTAPAAAFTDMTAVEGNQYKIAATTPAGISDYSSPVTL